ncbi:MAG: helix-turn-helix domain-containing protein [Sphingomonas sp.]
MTYNANFVREGQAIAAAPYEYKECGLEGIFLHNGYDIMKHDGELYASVEDTEGLHRKIGEFIVATRKELAPKEIRFLRNTMELTQSELGRWIGQSSQQVARWEKGQSDVPGPADRLIRAIFMLKTMDPEEREDFLELLRNIEDMDDLTPRRLELYLNGHQWQDHREAA